MKKIIKVLSFVLVGILFSRFNVYATDYTVSIPLELNTVNSNQSIIEKFNFELIPEDESNPMPENTQDGVYSLTVDEDGVYYIDNIEYNQTGDYVYYAYQVAGDNNQFEYDDSIYTIIVSVVNNEDLTDLEIHVTITKNEEEEKYSTLYFENTYNEPTTEVDTSDINLLFILLTFSISIIGIINNFSKIKKMLKAN